MAYTEHFLLNLSKDLLASTVLYDQGKFNFVLQSKKEDVSDFFAIPYLTSRYNTNCYNKLF